ncbi:hypothetical protein Bca4012_020813 [Brassica carinata]
MASDHPPDPPDPPPQPSTSDLLSLPKESISQSSNLDLVNSDLDSVAAVSSPANPALPGAATFSSGGLSSVVRSPSSSEDIPLLPLPILGLSSSEFPALVSGSTVDAFIVQEWSHKFSYSKPNLEAIPVWVKLSNVPCDLITEVGLFHIGGALGHPIGVKNLNGFSSGEVQVRINLSKPLPKFIELETDDGDVITVEASYLRLPRVCSHCRIVGHRESSCETIDQSPSDKVQGNGNISVSLESQINTTGPLIAEPQKATSTPEIIIASTRTDVLEKSATNKSLQETTPTTNESLQEADPDNSDTTTNEKMDEEIVPFPDRVSAPYAVQFESPEKTCVSPSKAQEFESSPFSSPLEGNDTMKITPSIVMTLLHLNRSLVQK